MNKQIILNHFLSAIIMGQEIFLIYKDKAQDEKLKIIIEDFINSLINQKKEMEKYISKTFQINEELSLLQKNALILEKIKTKKINDDYSLCINIIKTMNKAIVGALNYFYKCDKEIRSNIKDIVENTLSNYDNIIGKLKNYIIKDLS